MSFCESWNFLGVCLVRSLKLDYHVRTVCGKVSKTTGIFYNLLYCVSTGVSFACI